MGVDTPLALLALLAGALPYIAHRIRRRDLPRIVLPTFALLLATANKQQNRRDLGDLLLLIVRTALLLVAALSLAGPFIMSEVAFGDGQVSSVMFVIDDSMSMRRAQGSDTLLDLAIARADAAIAALPAGSEAGIVLAGEAPRVLLDLGDDLGHARTLLRSIVASDRGTRIAEATLLAQQRLRVARGERRRMLVLSDFARASEPPDLKGQAGIEVRFERVGDEGAMANLYFAQVTSAKDPLQKGHLSLSVVVGSYGDYRGEARLQVRGGEGKQDPIPLAFEGGASRVTLSVKAPAQGQDPVVRLVIDAEDALSADNHYELLVDRSDAVRVLLVNGDPHPGTSQDELFYARKALNLLPRTSEALRVRTIDAASLRHEDLTQCDVLVLANVMAPAPEIVKRLEAFVSSGGGLLITAGDAVNKDAYNAALAGLLPGHLGAISRMEGISLKPESDADGFLPTGFAGLHEVRFTRHLLVDSGRPPLLRFSDGTAAVSQRSVGDGNVVLFAATLDDGWTDLPFRPGFIPLLSGLLHVASGQRASFASSYKPGDLVNIPVPSGARVMEVVAPEGDATRLSLSEDKTAPFAATHVSGGYRVLAGEGQGGLRFVPGLSFAVQSAPQESDVRAGPMPVVPAGDSGPADGAPVTRSKKPLAPYLWLLAGLLLAAEALLRSQKERGHRPRNLQPATP